MPILRVGKTSKRGTHIRIGAPDISDLPTATTPFDGSETYVGSQDGNLVKIPSYITGQTLITTNVGSVTVIPVSNWYINLGLGSLWTITPTYSTRLAFTVSGIWTAPTGVGNQSLFTVEYGTGTAPVNGFDPGGIISNGYNGLGYVSLGDDAVNNPLELSGILTLLTPGTAYWLDVAVNSNIPTGPIGLSYITVIAYEF